jgi:hypothetical protein
MSGVAVVLVATEAMFSFHKLTFKRGTLMCCVRAIFGVTFLRVFGGGVLLTAGLLGANANEQPGAAGGDAVRHEAQVSKDQQPQRWGDPVDGLATALTTRRSDFPRGAPVEVRLWIKNVARQDKQVEHCGFWPNHRLRVWDKQGREVPTTGPGAAAREAFKQPERRKSFFVTLAPGKIDDAYEWFDLHTYFVLPAGKIEVECESWLGGRSVSSNRLTITVNGQ